MAFLDSALRLLAGRAIADIHVDFARLPAYRAEHFPVSGPLPWLDRNDWEGRIGNLPADAAMLCRQWAEKGFVILPKFIPDELLNDAWQAYEDAVRSRTIVLPDEPGIEGDRLPGRFLNPHRRVPEFKRVAKYSALMGVLGQMLGYPARLLQTIASHKGSQQAAHSDSIHMTTYPLGYLAAAWIAFEDIHEDSGPLEYYPGSHRLPYVFSHDLGISVDDMKHEGYATYRARYEPLIQGQVAAAGLKPEYFKARKGDVLIWHANLLHGGSPRRDPALSRKALVAHYFAKGAFVYHDLSAESSRRQYLPG